MEPTKKCKTCGEEKPLGDYYIRKCDGGYLFSNCKKCHGSYTRKREKETREVTRERRMKWVEKNREKIRKQQKEIYWKDVEASRKRGREKSIKETYGITQLDKARMLKDQGGCAACGSDNPGTVKGWHIDHCHFTGKIRGVLCHPCNAALGNARDSIDRLRQLIDYLTKYNERENRMAA